MAAHWKVESLDLDNADEVTKAAYLSVARRANREALPGDLPPTDAEIWAGCLNLHPKRPSYYFGIWDDDRTQLLGTACVSWEEYEDNQEMSNIELDVLPDARRQKAGAALAQTAFEFARDNNRTLVNLDASDKVRAGWDFLAAIGAEHKLTGRFSLLKFAAVDRSQLEGWVARATERAADYELVRWDGACPEELVEAFVAEQGVMNTAPMEDMEWEHEVFTVARLRDREEMVRLRNIDLSTLVAVHRPTAEMVAHSDVWLPQHWPVKAYQNDTGVNPAHREKGLGRWLKAQMLLNLMRDRPQLEAISTWNAGSNDPMLGINYAMGFETITEFGEHQVRADVALEKLAALLG